MATEKRLIDASVALDALRKAKPELHVVSTLGYKAVDISAFIQFLENQQTVDAVEVPCKIGDRVWAIRNYRGHKHPQDGFVNEMYFADDMKLHIVVKHIARGEWGRTVFATREECVAAILGERKDDGA